ncbi:uncharacterized protein LOC144141335 [Haemaphysalis longicornis]
MVGCSAINCSGASEKGQRMFRFPWHAQRKMKWAVAVKRTTTKGALWMPGVGARLCQVHFVTGAPSKDPHHVDYVPSLFTYNEASVMTARKTTESYARHKALSEKRALAQMPADTSLNDSGEDDADAVDVPLPTHSDASTSTEDMQLDSAHEEPCGAAPRIRNLEAQVLQLRMQLEKCEASKLAKNMDEAKLQFYTGLSKAHFFAILSSIVPVLPPARCKCPHETQLLMFFMKLRLNVPFCDLAYRFDLTPKTVSQSFRRILEAVHHLMKSLVVFPSQEVCHSWLGEHELHHFPRLRAIIDCTEVSIARPLNQDEQQIVWSDYKHDTTLKYLVAVNTHGAVMFVSEAFGGRTSDKELTLSCGFMDKLEEGDQVLADRGFLLYEEFYENNVQLITPSFTKNKKQLAADEVTTSRRISSTRIIVERAIGHLKKWRIMTGSVHHTLVDCYDEIIMVVAGLTNLCPPLSKKGEVSPMNMAVQSEPAQEC